MADIIKTIGAAGSGADFATYQAWFAARTGVAGDRYIGEIITSTGGLSTGLATTGNYAMELVLRAAAGLEFDPANPTAPHAIISGTATATVNFPSSGAAKLTIENIEILSTAAAPTAAPLVNMGASTSNLTIKGCWLRGGRNGCQNAISGAKLLIENSIIQGTYRAGVHITFAGATVRNTVIVGCNTESGTTSAHCGMRKDLAGTVIENVVAYSNGVVDFFGTATNATVSYMASGDTSASGTGALTGVTSAAFTNYASGVFTAASGGILDGTGPSGNDRGIVTASNPTILLINPAANVFLARDKDTNTGNIAINGTCTDLTGGATIEARFNGGAWQVIDAAPTATFSGTLTGAAVGVGSIEVRVSNFVTATDSHANIAIGAKFLFWGQSNYSGRANNAQVYTGPAGWWRKRTIETNAQVTTAADPFDSYTVSGSIFPLLASQLTAELNCPVLFIGVAAGGTSLAQWQPGQTLNNRMLTYYNAESTTGHVEAVSSWIGEGDSVLGTAETDFKSRYNTVIDQLKALTGADSMLVAPSGENLTGYTNVRQWISDIAATSANTAPNEVQMWPLFQKIHYESDTETSLASTAVYNGLLNSFYREYKEGTFATSVNIASYLASGVKIASGTQGSESTASSGTTGVKIVSGTQGSESTTSSNSTGVKTARAELSQVVNTSSMLQAYKTGVRSFSTSALVGYTTSQFKQVDSYVDTGAIVSSSYSKFLQPEDFEGTFSSLVNVTSSYSGVKSAVAAFATQGLAASMYFTVKTANHYFGSQTVGSYQCVGTKLSSGALYTEVQGTVTMRSDKGKVLVNKLRFSTNSISRIRML